VGQTFSLRKAFAVGGLTVPAGEIVTVVSWSNAADTAEVSRPTVAGTFNVPKHLLKPAQTKVAGLAPYGVGLGKVESEVETGAASLEAFEKTQPQYRTARGRQFFAQELSERKAEQTRMVTK